MQTHLDAALFLARMGATIFPLHGIVANAAGHLNCTCGDANCKSAGKHPLAKLVPNGLKHASADEDTVRGWFTAAPSANIGFATGHTIVLDVDPRHCGNESLAAIEATYGAMPATLRSATGGGGQHIYFRARDGVEIRNSAGALGPGLDVRGAGGYVVLPPSLHASGQRYRWAADHIPGATPIAAMPDWLVRALASRAAIGAGDRSAEWRNLVIEGVAEGSRNTAVARLTGHLLRRYVDAVVAHELVQAWNALCCQPPLSPEEVTKVVNSVARKEFERREARNVVAN